MLVKMTKTSKGAPDGIRVNEYMKDIEYDIPEKLAKAFVLHMNVAEFIDAITPIKKSVQAAPQNKAMEVPKDKEVRVLTEDILKDDKPEPEPEKKKQRRKY